MQAYVREFLNLHCSGDVMNAVTPIGRDPEKEITESMGILKKFKGLFLANPSKYNLLDLCAGNALTSVLSVHLLPVHYANAIDIEERRRHWETVRNFAYTFEDVYSPKMIDDYVNENTIIISVHACSNLARRIVEIYNNSKAKALFLMPCCLGSLKRKYPQEIESKLGNYMMFCWDLAQTKCRLKLRINT